jgi:hypothetical protein
MSEFTSLTDNIFKRFLEEKNDGFEEKVEYEEEYLEELINQEDPMLLDAKSNNLMQEIINIQDNGQEFNIFHSENFIQAHQIIQNKEMDECNSNSDNEIEEENINKEQELGKASELQNEDEEYVMDEIPSTTPLSPCIIVDIIDGELQTCSKDSKKTISQLVGTWQIDTNVTTEFLNKKINLGVCMPHFNYDQKNHSNQAKQLRNTENSTIHRKRCLFCEKYIHFFSRGRNCRQHSWNVFNRNIQVPCNGQFSCNAFEIRQNITKLTDADFSDPRYVCCSCFEINGGHIHQQSGSGKPKFSCEKAGLHDEDTNKMLIALASWLSHIAKTQNVENKKNILTSMLEPALNFLQEKSSLKKNKEIPHFESISDLDAIHQLTISSTSSQDNIQLPTLFAFQILLKLNKVSNKEPSELNIPDEQWPDIGKKLADRIWKSRKELNEQKSKIQNPASLENYYSAFPLYLTGFFGNLCKNIFEKKLKISNRTLKSRKKPLKQLNEKQIMKIVTFLVSVLIGITFPGLQVWFTQVLASLSRRPKLMQQFRHLLSVLQISGHTDNRERILEKARMKSIDPCQRLNKNKNIWNLGVIDNIDFKEATFRYGNIFDTIRTSTHTTLRMVFQHQMSFDLCENKNDENQVNSPLGLFGMNQIIKNTLDIFDSILDGLLNIKIDSQGMVTYQTNFDMATVHEKILDCVEHGCEINPPNVIILEPGGNPSSDEGIFESIQMYKKDLNLESEDYLDIVADEAIFRRMIKQMDQLPQLRPILGQWHTSKDMCSVLIVLFSSYGIFDLADWLGVQFLEKLESVVDYRSTVRVLELIWTAVALAIRIYIKKKNISKQEIWESDAINSAFQIWYLYYQWAGIFKAHRIGIRVGNYDLQKNALAAFSGLFASAAKTRYASSVCHFIGLLAKFPKLEKKLHHAASIKIDNNEKRKGHFFAYDEALETFGVKFIKQNITGNVINIENLKIQIKSAQTERDRIGILLSEYLDDPTAPVGNHAINQRYDAMWNLVNILLQEFNQTNESFLNSNRWKNVYRAQLTPEGVAHLKNCFPDGVIRMRAIFCEDVLKTMPSQSGRSKLGVPKLKISTFQKELKEAEKSKKKKRTLDSQLQSQTNAEGSTAAQSESHVIEVPAADTNDAELPRKRKRKAKRIASLEEEALLEPLIQSQNDPTNQEMKDMLNTLSDNWDIGRIKQHVQYRRKKRAASGTSNTS